MPKLSDDLRGFIQVRNPYNYDRDAVSRETGLQCDDVTLTKQSFKDECDINQIVDRFLKTGALPENVAVPQFGDFDTVNDYQSALAIVMAADEAFMSFPHDFRARFSNDPAQFIEFVHNPANREECIKLGLIEKPLDNPPTSGNVPSAASAAPTGDNNGNS